MSRNNLLYTSAFVVGALVSCIGYGGFSDNALSEKIALLKEVNEFESGAGRGTVELQSIDPPKAHVDFNAKSRPAFSTVGLDSEWDSAAVNEKVLVNMPDIESIIALRPPEPSNNDPGDWYRFALKLNEISTGKRYSHRDYTSPLFAWDVYIAKHSPETIYRLFDEDKMSGRKFGHLAQFGLLGDWWENVTKRDRLILRDSSSLLSLVFRLGEDKAARLFVDAFFNNAVTRSEAEIEVLNFLFSLSAMSEDQKHQALQYFADRTYKIDPRHVEFLNDTRHWWLSDRDVLNLIRLNAFEESSRSMSSFFIGAAKLGDEQYFSMLLHDIPANDGQPTNFYCSACGVALVADGLLGSPLVEQLKKGRAAFHFDKKRNEYIVGESR